MAGMIDASIGMIDASIGKPKLLDLFCGAGGCSHGYSLAGFEVTGVDNKYISNYPYKFIQADAVDYLRTVKYGDFVLIHASPPCQNHSWCSSKWPQYNKYDSLISVIRDELLRIECHYVMENVLGSTLNRDKCVLLDGIMFNLRVTRKRLFETNWLLQTPDRGIKVGSAKSHTYVTPAGHGGNGPNNYLAWALAMKINWMTKDQLAQAIPPAYTRYIGKEFLELIG